MGAPTTQETEAAIVNRKCTTHIAMWLHVFAVMLLNYLTKRSLLAANKTLK